MELFFGNRANTGVILVVSIFLCSHISVLGVNIDLPPEHLPFYFNNFPDVAKECMEDPECPYKAHLNKDICWGYEDNCVDSEDKRYSNPVCNEDHKGWVKTKKEQVDTFYQQGDFGYVHSFRNSMKVLCAPDEIEDSSLECSEHLTFCRGRNIMIDFRRLENRTTPVMYDMDVLAENEIGGYCKLDRPALKSELDLMSPLQSWAPEIQHFTELDTHPMKEESKLCDRIIRTPTFLMKIDATVNMYHHFCDFFNLYASLFVNSTSKNSDFFSKNIRIGIWRTYKYTSNFEATFRAFTSFPIMDLNDFKGKRVCFKNVVFPLPPRMIFGLFYNTPLIWGCQNSGLFHAFSQFTLHRLRVDLKPELDTKKIKVTFLSRLTKFRRVLNEDDLIEELSRNPNLIVNKVAFTWKTDFVEQLNIIKDTDILIGMHGAGLTHMLFLPDWAVVFELYNCGDGNCYADLARLRGLKYITWNDNSLLHEEPDIPQQKDQPPGHEKHKNYVFDTPEFVRLMDEGVQYLEKYSKDGETETIHDEF